MARSLTLGVMLFLMAASGAWGAMKQIVMKDGREFVGDVTDTPGGYRIKTRYSVMEVSKDEVRSISDVASFAEEYKRREALCDANSADDYCKLAQWAFSCSQPGSAQKAARKALEIDKNHAGAKKLLELISAGQVTPPRIDTPVDKVDTTAGTTAPGAVALVKQADIDRIRLAELSKDDREMPIVFKNNLIKRFHESKWGKQLAVNPADLRAFNTSSTLSKALYLRDNVDADGQDLINDIQVKGDPKPIRVFRDSVWPLVQGRCGASGCHGGQALNGTLRLVPRGEPAIAVLYTNFLLLDGVRSKAGDKVIDRNQPERSLLLRHGLSQQSADKEDSYRHPPVKQWSWIFKNTKDRQYQAVLRWIGSLRAPHPLYTLDFVPPEGMKLEFGSSVDDLMKPADPIDTAPDKDKDGAGEKGTDKAPGKAPDKGVDTGGPKPASVEGVQN